MTRNKRNALGLISALGLAFLCGTCGAETLKLTESATWTDLSALANYDGVEIASDVTLTLAPASGAMALTKPISGAGGVVKDGAGSLELRCANTFTGSFVIGGTGNVYAYANGAFGSAAGRTTLYECLYTEGFKDADKAGANLYLCGITTDEGFDLVSDGREKYLYGNTNTASTINGSVTVTGGQTSIYALGNATLRFRGGIGGTGTLRPSTAAGAMIIVEEKPMTCEMWNSKSGAGTMLLAASGNKCSYTFQPLTLGCDWAFNGCGVNWDTGGTHMKIDLNGYENRVSSIKCGKAAMNGWVTSTGGKALLHDATTGEVSTALPFRGEAGYSHDGSGTTTFVKNTVCTSDTWGELCVGNGAVVFENGAAWPYVSGVTVKGTGALTLAAADQIGTTAVLTLADNGLLTLPDEAVLTVKALTVDGEAKAAGTYEASSLGGHVAGEGVTVRVTGAVDILHVTANATWNDAMLAQIGAYAGVSIDAGATLTLENTTAYTLTTPVSGAGTLVLAGTAAFVMDAANPDFDGKLEVRGSGNRLVTFNNAGVFGTTSGLTEVHLCHNDGTGQTGTGVRFMGFETAENFSFIGANPQTRIYGAAGTTTTFNGDVASSGNQVSFLPEVNATFVFNKSFTGGTAAMSPKSGAEIVFNCPCTASYFNSHETAGKVVFNATGNAPLGYFCCTATFGVDYAWDGIDPILGMYYYNNVKVDLNGHDQRVSNISHYASSRPVANCSYVTDTSGAKAFLHVKATADGESRVYFKGTAGLWWESAKTVTFKESASTSQGDLMVAAGRVVFDTATWLGGDVATVKSGAVLEIKNAANFAFHRLVVEEGGKVVLATGTLYAREVTLGDTIYPAGSTVKFADHADYLEGAATISCNGDFVIDTPAASADTVVTNEVAIPAGTLRIIKRGAGTCYVKGSNAATGAEIIIEEGVLGVVSKDDVGVLLKKGLSAITVKDGGTFDLGGMNYNNAATIMGATRVMIAGKGATKADGTRLGAIRRTNRTGGEENGNMHKMLSSLILMDDATVCMSGGDCGCMGGRFVMNGHTLTKTGGSQWYLCGFGGEVTPGNFLLEQGNIIFHSDVKILGGATNTVRVTGGTLMINECTDTMHPVPHALIWENASAKLSVYNKRGRWGGPWTLNTNMNILRQTKGLDDGHVVVTGPAISTNQMLTLTHTQPTLTFSGENHHDFGGLNIAGALELKDGAEGEIHPYSWGGKTEITIAQSTAQDVASTWGYPARMTISNATLASPIAETKAPNVYGNFVLAWSKNNGAELNIEGDSTVTGLLWCAQEGLGVVRQSGGEFVSKDLSGKNERPTTIGGGASTSYGAYLLSGGRFSVDSALSAANTSGSASIIRQSGGTFESGINGSESFDARAGYLSICQTGGVFTNASAISFGHYAAANQGDGGRYEIFASGEDTYQYNYWDIRVSSQNGNIDSTVYHLANGATLDLRCFNYTKGGKEAKRFTFGADGGVLKPHYQGNLFLGSDPDRATLYGGGLVVDTGAAKGLVQISTALRRPVGKVVTGIALPTAAAFAKETKYLGPAKIVISGGSGEGATAVTEFDPATRTLTGITVASPGFGYAAGDAVMATVDGAFRTNTYACAVTLGDPDTTGGLTKRGANRLLMTGANDYRGITRIEGGTLEFGEGAFPAESDVVITAEAANEAAAKGQYALIVNGFPAGRTITVADAEKVDFAGLRRAIRLAQFTGTLPMSVTLKAIDSDGNPYTLPNGNELYYANGKIRLGPHHGMLLIVR